MEQTISLTPHQLADLIGDAVNKVVNKGSGSKDDDLLNVPETIQFLRCSRQHLWKLRQQGKIRAIELGGKLLFSKAELNIFIKESQEDANHGQ